MKYSNVFWNDLSAKVSLSIFHPDRGVEESHVMIELTDVSLKTADQFNRLDQAVERLRFSSSTKGLTLVWKRYFLSDAINQASFITSIANEAISFIQQPPLNGTKIALWLYFIEDAFLSTQTDGTVTVQRPAYSHFFHTQLHERTGDVAFQTQQIFERYANSLAVNQCLLKEHCIRTWIYVHDVDIQYMGMVNARKSYFEKIGMTTQTHYLASTGIEGRYIYPEVLVTMDAYAIQGIHLGQVNYLQALTHLNPTYEYGVTFERGTTVDYGDRRHVFISGTASINNKGEIVHPLDIEGQVQRILINIQALLAEAEASMQDIAQLIIYLRDPADYKLVSQLMESLYPEMPQIITFAPVCRPGWLIEMECIAIKAIDNESFEKF